MRNDGHSEFHSKSAFCGYAGPEEMQHLQDLIDELTDEELKQLVRRVGITFDLHDSPLDREVYESVIDEADREVFYREYRRIIKSRSKK